MGWQSSNVSTNGIATLFSSYARMLNADRLNRLSASVGRDAAMFGPRLNLDYLGEEFATVWEKDVSKLFLGQEETLQNQQAEAEAVSPGAGAGAVTPQNKLPTAESALGTQTSNTLQ